MLNSAQTRHVANILILGFKLQSQQVTRFTIAKRLLANVQTRVDVASTKATKRAALTMATLLVINFTSEKITTLATMVLLTLLDVLRRKLIISTHRKQMEF